MATTPQPRKGREALVSRQQERVSEGSYRVGGLGGLHLELGVMMMLILTTILSAYCVLGSELSTFAAESQYSLPLSEVVMPASPSYT